MTDNHKSQLLIKYFIIQESNYHFKTEEPYIIVLDDFYEKNEIISYDTIINYLKEDGLDIDRITIIKIFIEDIDAYINIKNVDNFFNLDKKCINLQIFVRNDIEQKSYIFKKLCQKYEIFNNKLKAYDLIYLYSAPIFTKIKDKPDSVNPCYELIDYHSEIQLITDVINNRDPNIKFTANFINLTLENLFNAIKKCPKILHISSHGEISDNEFYLTEDNGTVRKITETEIKEKIKNLRQIKSIELVFLSACHSEKLGKMFIDIGFKNVIYIQKETEISDMAAQEFTKKLYEKLLDKKTIEKSVEESRNYLKDKVLNAKLKECCCKHKHKEDCKFVKNKEEIHKHCHNKEEHKCTCKYNEYNVHNSDCRIIKYLKSQNWLGLKHVSVNDDSCIKPCIKICCCNIDIAHNESKKFLLVGKDLDRVIFNETKLGMLKINDSCFLRLKEKVRNYNINLILYRIDKAKQLVDNILDNSGLNIFQIIYGSKGSGKEPFIYSLLTYLYERELISSFDTITIDSFFQPLEKSLIEIVEKTINTNKRKYNKPRKRIVVFLFSPYFSSESSLWYINEKLIPFLKENFHQFYYIIKVNTMKDKLYVDITHKSNNICLEHFTRDEVIKLLRLEKKKISEKLNELEKHLQEKQKDRYSYEELSSMIDYITNSRNNEKLDNFIDKSLKFELPKKEEDKYYLFILSSLPNGITETQKKMITDKIYKNDINNKKYIDDIDSKNDTDDKKDIKNWKEIYIIKYNKYCNLDDNNVILGEESYKVNPIYIPKILDGTLNEIKKKIIIYPIEMYAKIFIGFIKSNFYDNNLLCKNVDVINLSKKAGILDDLDTFINIFYEKDSFWSKSKVTTSLPKFKEDDKNIIFLLENNLKIIKEIELIPEEKKRLDVAIEAILLAIPIIYQIKDIWDIKKNIQFDAKKIIIQDKNIDNNNEEKKIEKKRIERYKQIRLHNALDRNIKICKELKLRDKMILNIITKITSEIMPKIMTEEIVKLIQMIILKKKLRFWKILKEIK